MIAVRRALRRSGAPARAALVGLIRLYRLTLSGWLGGQCRFHPSCSHYAEEAIRVHGALRGTVLAGWRIVRCNPFGGGGPEPVPPASRSSDPLYDNVIRERSSRSLAR